MSTTAEVDMAMPRGNAADVHDEDPRSSELVIKAPTAMAKGGNAVRAVTADVRQAWPFTGAPPAAAKLLAQLREPSVAGDNAALKALLRAYLVLWGIPSTWLFYGLAWAQQRPARAVVVDGALVGLTYVWLS